MDETSRTAAEFEYDVFISFRHEDARKEARSLRLDLLRWKTPLNIRAAVRHPLRVYVDTFEGRVTRDYWVNNIKPALQNSRFLIVLVSPSVFRQMPDGSNNWVVREIETFLDRPQGTNIVPVYTRSCRNKTLPDVLAKTLPRVQTFDLGRRDRFMPLVPFIEKPGKLDFLSIVAAIREVDNADYPILFREEGRRRVELMAWSSAAAIGVSATIAAGGVLAIINGVAATRAAANADLHMALESLQAEPDISALFAARALDTVTRTILFNPFLQHEERKIRTLLGSIVLPASVVRWPGGRVDRLALTPDGKRVAVWTERSRLALLDTRTFSARVVDIPQIGTNASMAFAGTTLVVSGEYNDHPRMALVDSDGKTSLLPPVAKGDRQILLSDGRVLRWNQGLIEIVNLVTRTSKAIGRLTADRLEEATLVSKASRVIVHASIEGPGSYRQYVFDTEAGGQIGPAAISYQMSPWPIVSDQRGIVYRPTNTGVVERIDLASGRPLKAIPGSGQRVSKIAASPNGDVVVVWRANFGGVEIWDTLAMTLVVPPLGPYAATGDPVFDAREQRIVLPNEAGALLIDRRNPGDVITFPLDRPVHAAALLSGERWLALADRTGRVSIWDASNGTPLVRGIKHQEGSVSLLALPDGRLISGGWDGSVRATTVGASREAAWVLPTNPATLGSVTNVAVHPSADLVAFTNDQPEIALCKIGAKQCAWRKRLPLAARSVGFASGGRIVFVALEKGFAAFDMASGALIASEPDGIAAADPRNARAAIATKDGPVRVTGLPRNGGAACRSPVRLGVPSLIQFTPEGHYVIVVSSDAEQRHHLTVFDSSSCERVWSAAIRHKPVQTLASSERLNVVAVGGAFGGEFYHLKDGSDLATSLVERNLVTGIAIHPKLPKAVVLGASGQITGLNLAHATQSFTPFRGGPDPWFVSFDPEGDMFAVAWLTPDKDQQFSATLHDSNFGQQIAPTFVHPSNVYSANVTYDGRYLVTSCGDGNVRAWDLKTEGRTAGEVLSEVVATTAETIDLESGAIRAASH